MLLRFRVSNWASIREEQELSLVASDKHDDLAVKDIPGTGLQVLPVVGVFGANASGKSNLMASLAYARSAVRHSHNRWNPSGGTGRVPFLLDGEGRARPSEFEFEFAQRGVRYQYGFSVDDEKVTGEWLYSWPHGRPRMLFERDEEQHIELGPGLRRGFGSRTQIAKETVRPNSLLVSAGAAGNHPLLTSIYTWFERLNVAHEPNAQIRLDLTLRMLSGAHAELCSQLMRYADLGITDVHVTERKMPEEAAAHFTEAFRLLNPHSPPTDPDSWRWAPEIVVTHQTPDGSTDLPYAFESSGTHTWLEMVGIVVQTLVQGAVLVVDELDARLHPNLVGQLVRLFSEPETNPNGAQILFNTHDVTLLSRHSYGHLTRDQAWFTRKGSEGATELVALREYKVRSERDDVFKKYLLGAFDAIPLFEEQVEQRIGDLLAKHAVPCGNGSEEVRKTADKAVSRAEKDRNARPRPQVPHLL
ncbi:AAA family ATPase [Nocardiopsis algeriensis]|uniref:AAA family ATPase n=1 Tax=Nocardiopsis algeriensis TaxID=1478215 RepID=UPI003B439BFC